MGFAGGMPERIIEKRRAWWAHGLRNVQGAAHAQRRDAGGFNVPGDQSNGLMADGSHRDEQHCVDVFSQEALGELRRQFLAHPPRRVDATHEGVGMGGQRAKRSFTHQTT